MVHYIGTIHQLVRYPVKSMAGISTDSAFLGWHGIEGDRRYAFRRMEDKSCFPWLSASKLPEMILYHPAELNDSGEPAFIRTPDGRTIAIDSPELNTEISQKYSSPVELMKLKHGIFDDASISVINLATIAALGSDPEKQPDPRRFRANIYFETQSSEPFLENEWVGGRLVFGDPDTGPVINVTIRDIRCMMINLDPDTAEQDPRIMKASVKMNDNCAGIYANVMRTGELRVGQQVSLIL